MVRVFGSFKRCSVPGCANSTTTAPQKLFALRQIKRKRPQAWPKDVVGHPAASVYVCEDHFELGEDAEDVIKWRPMKLRKTSAKKAARADEVPVPAEEALEAAISLCLLSQEDRSLPWPDTTCTSPEPAKKQDKGIQCKPQKCTKSIQCDLGSPPDTRTPENDSGERT